MKETIKNEITEEKIKKYFNLSTKAYNIAKKSKNKTSLTKEREDILNMIKCYLDDSEYFFKNKDFINAFAALNYAHGWIDCAARLKIFDVHDSKLFTVDDKE